ncbi:replicase [Cherry virus B]|uniref:Replicase n=1 Tax=Cherry virus B TaxID=2108357 RepID=A0AAD1FUH0_9VIRU|nr:replicase [Cherry virus B]BBD14449.1 replicase [Cherry virus B]
MALSYRSPIEEVLNRFTSEEQSRIGSTAVARLSQVELANHKLFSFSLNERAKEKLIRSGIYLSPYSFEPHSHPACKTLENHILYNVLVNKLDNSFYAVGIKGSKVNFLKSRSKNLSMLEYVNRVVTSADKYRYGSDFTTLSTQEIDGLKPKCGFENCASLKTLVPLLKMSKKRNFFLHDELHYWDSKDLMLFLEATVPDHLLCTFVFPPEILAGSKTSLNPWCYKYEINSRSLTFFPDGVQSEAYCQPLNSGQLLKTKKIVCPNGLIYSVDVVYSCFAHHIISITKGDLPGLERRHFSNFDAVSASKLSGMSNSIRDCIPISSDVVSRLYRYIRTLKKPDLQSCMAKLSQIVPEPTGFEIKFTEDFSRLAIEIGPAKSLLMPETSKIIGAFFASLLPFKMARLFDCYKSVSLDHFISDLQPFSFSVELSDMTSSSHLMFETITLAESIDPAEVEKMINSFSSPLTISQRTVSTTNQDYPGDIFHGLHHVMDGCPIFVIKNLVRKLVHSFMNEVGVTQKSAYISSFVVNTLKRFSSLNFDYNIGTDFHFEVKAFVVGIISKARRTMLVYFQDNQRIWLLMSDLRAYQKALMDDHYNPDLSIEQIRLQKDLNDEIRGFNQKLKGYSSSNNSSAWSQSEHYSSSEHVKPQEVPQNFEYQGSQADLQSEPVFGSNIPSMVVTPQQEGKNVDDQPTMLPRESADDSMVVVDCNPTCGDLATFSGEGVNGSIFSKLVMEQIHNVGRLTPIQLRLPKSLKVTKLKGRDCYFFTRCNCIDYGHNKIKYQPNPWLSELDLILEDESTYFNACLLQIYSEGGKIGFHADDEKVYNHSSIKTVNLSGSATFTVKGKGRSDMGQTTQIRLNDGDFFTMGPNFQAYYQHSVGDCSSNRVSLTFRNHVNKISGEKIKHVCGEYGDSEELFGVLIQRNLSYRPKNFHTFPVPGDGSCFWHSTGALLGVDGESLKKICQREIQLNSEMNLNTNLHKQMEGKNYAERESIAAFCHIHSIHLIILIADMGFSYEFIPNRRSEVVQLFIKLTGDHFEPALPINGCVVKAISKTLNQPETKILAVLGRPDHRGILESLSEGDGLNIEDLEAAFCAFGIRAKVSTDKGLFDLNPEGAISANFELKKGHIIFLENKNLKEFSPTTPIGNFNNSGPELFLKGVVSEVSYKPNLERAVILEESLLSGTTGILCDRIINLQKEWLLPDREMQLGERNIGVVLGTFGSGKSSLFKRFIVKNPSRPVVFVSPRRSLADQIKEDLGLNQKRGKTMRVRVLTLESFIKAVFTFKSTSVVIDEIQLYPPGYLDLLLLCLNQNCRVYVAGDPCQSDYDSAKDRALFSGMKSDIDTVLEGKSYRFNAASKRFSSTMFVGRLPCFMDQTKMDSSDDFHWLESLEEASSVSLIEYDVVLVSSFEEKKIAWAHLGRDVEVLTFGESTGLTFNKGMIIVSYDSQLAGEKRWITALSRFRKNIIFVNLVGNSMDDVCQVFNDRVLHKFLCKRATIDDILINLPGTPKITSDFEDKVGKGEGLMESKLVGDPWLKTQIDLLQDEDQEIEEMQIEFAEEPWFKTHLPLYDLEPLRAAWVHRLMLREKREVRCGSEVSTQFPDDHPNKAVTFLANAAERFEAIYPRHRGNDSVTFLMAVKKRLSFSRPSVESAKLNRAKPYGKFLLNEFLKRVPLRGTVDPQLMAQAKREFEEKKTSKSAAVIENHAGRSCRDWLADVGFIFMKSQFCSKWDNRFRDAKAGQTLACFHHSILCRFAPYMRYIEHKLNHVLPQNLYIHSGKNLEDLSEWVKTNRFSGECTESDYEAFDSSQDHYILSFEIELMKHLQLPWDLIEDYVYIKTHLGSKLGNFSIMRFTGEASTFLFNTMANMLFTFLRYDLNGSEAICFAGDDMCANRRLRVSKKHEGFLSKLRLKAKVQFTTRPTFCGWNLCLDGIFKRPQLVLERLCVAREKNNLVNCLDSYAIEVGYAFRLGEKVVDYMDDEALSNHYNCIRFIVKHSNLLKSSVRDLFIRGS